jgi:hypothetical protein
MFTQNKPKSKPNLSAMAGKFALSVTRLWRGSRRACNGSAMLCTQIFLTGSRTAINLPGCGQVEEKTNNRDIRRHRVG